MSLVGKKIVPNGGSSFIGGITVNAGDFTIYDWKTNKILSPLIKYCHLISYHVPVDVPQKNDHENQTPVALFSLDLIRSSPSHPFREYFIIQIDSACKLTNLTFYSSN